MSNIKLIEDFIAAWNRLDFPAIEGFMAPDIFYHNIPMPPCNGIAEFRAFMAALPAEKAEWTIHAIAENGPLVLTERTDRFQMPGGKWLSVRVMGAFEIANGKIAKWRDYFDMAEFTSQLG